MNFTGTGLHVFKRNSILINIRYILLHFQNIQKQTTIYTNIISLLLGFDEQT